jgi:hypothetical protein
VADDGRHFEQSVAGTLARNAASEPVPDAHQAEINHQNPIFERAARRAVAGAVTQKICEQPVIAVKRAMDVLQRSSTRFIHEMIASFEESELIGRSNLSGVVAGSLSAEN